MSGSDGACGVYVMMVLPISNQLRFRNAMMRNSSILNNYTGRLVCVAPKVQAVEGGWPGNRTVALIYFSSEWHAKQYLDSDPLVKQPDFMDGIDVIIVHLKEIPPLGDHPYFVIADVKLYDVAQFIDEYSSKSAKLRDGKVVVTAACPEPISWRGTWKPNMIIINQWRSEQDYMNFYHSDEYQPLKALRQRIAHSRIISMSNDDC